MNSVYFAKQCYHLTAVTSKTKSHGVSSSNKKYSFLLKSVLNTHVGFHWPVGSGPHLPLLV